MTAQPQRIEVALPAGPVEVSAEWERPAEASAAIAIAHGAGTALNHLFLTGLSERLGEQGIASLRFNFPYSEAGRRMPGPPAHALATWAAIGAWTERTAPDLAWFAAGKSYGGRMASMAAADGVIAPAGLIYLGYPLHPPGDPAKARIEHLPDVPQPQLFIEGTNDPFIDPHDQLEAAVASCRDAALTWIEGAGHSFEVKGRRRPADQIGGDLAPIVAEWMRTRV